MKTLIFCTAYASTSDTWNTRYRRWIDAIRKSRLRFDQILLIDDGSPVLPDWDDVTVVQADRALEPPDRTVLYHFPNSLGRQPGHNHPGWYRSYAFAAEYARRHDFRKVIHIESDSFLIGAPIQRYFNSISVGWIALWDGFFGMPLSAIQVMAGSGLDRYHEVTRCPYSEFVDHIIELALPFSQTIKYFRGGKYGEFLDYVPVSAEYVVQATEDLPAEFFWWLDQPGNDDELNSPLLLQCPLQARTLSEVTLERIVTSFGSVLYVDDNTLQLKHGPVATSPKNTFMARTRSRGQVVFVANGVVRDLNFTYVSSRVMAGDSGQDEPGAPPLFTLLEVEGGLFGLKSGQLFLSAKPGWDVLLDRQECLGWEQFRLLPAQTP